MTTSASGYEDGFGRRLLAFAREDGAAFERLYLRPQFSIYERALADTFARVAAHGDGRIVGPRAIERDAATGALVATSPFVSGERLTDLLEAAAERARDDQVVPGIDVALGFLAEVLPALAALRAATGLSHGAVAPSRCVFTPDGRVVLTESGFGAVLQRLNLSRERLWKDFGVAVPPVAGPARFDETADVSQATLMAVMLIVGRPMTALDATDVLPEWLAEVIEIAQIRGSMSFAVNLQRFLQRALPLPGRRPYQTIDSAWHDVRQLAATIGLDQCRAALVEFVRHVTAPAGAALDEWTAGDARPAPVASAAAAPPIERVADSFVQLTAVGEPDVPEVTFEPPFVPEPVPLDAETLPAPDEPVAVEAPIYESIAEPEVGAPDSFAADARAPEPMALEPPAFEPVAFEPAPEPIALETAAEPIPVEPPAPEPVAVEPPPPSRRRRWRLRRAERDTLRSAVVPPPAPPPPAPAPAAAVTPPVAAPVATVPAPVAEVVVPLPLVAQPQPPLVPILVQPPPAPPAVPQPVFEPLASSPAETLWTPSIEVVPAQPIVLKPKPVAVTLAPPAPLKLKTDAPPGFSGRTPRYEEREVFAGYSGPRRPPGAAPARKVPWKFAAAAAIVIVTVIAAGRVYLPGAPSVEAEAPRTAPITVTAPPPVTTGTLAVQTQPAGARVLLDGSPVGETPLRIVDVAPGRHVLTFVTPTATLRRTVKVEANKTLTLDVPVFSGWVAIFAPIVLEVSEEGRALGSTDQGRLLLPPGRHTLTLTNRDFGYSADHAVEVEAGEVRSLNIQPSGTVNLNAVPWAEVWIDGKKAGETPIANLQLPLGNREIIFRHPELGERKMMTRITAGAPVAVSVDFSSR